MKTYEYKFVETKTKLGLDFSKKVSDMERQWNEWGLEGWKFCTSHADKPRPSAVSQRPGLKLE